MNYMNQARPRRQVLPQQGLYQQPLRPGQTTGDQTTGQMAPSLAPAQPGQTPQQRPQIQQNPAYNQGQRVNENAPANGNAGVRQAGSAVKSVTGDRRSVLEAQRPILPPMDHMRGALGGVGASNQAQQDATRFGFNPGSREQAYANEAAKFTNVESTQAPVAQMTTTGAPFVPPQGQTSTGSAGLGAGGADPNASGFRGTEPGERITWADGKVYTWDGEKWSDTGTTDQAGASQGSDTGGGDAGGYGAGGDPGLGDANAVESGTRAQGKDGNWYTAQSVEVGGRTFQQWVAEGAGRADDYAAEIAASRGVDEEEVKWLLENGYHITADGEIYKQGANGQAEDLGDVGDAGDPGWETALGKSAEAKEQAGKDEAKRAEDEKNARLRSLVDEANAKPVDQVDQGTLDELIAAQRQSRGLDLANAMSAFNDQSSRLGMSPEAATSVGARTQYASGVEGREAEAKTRMQAELTNLQANMTKYASDIRMIENLMGMTQDDATLRALQAGREQMLAMQTQAQKEIARYQADLMRPSFGDAMLGLGANILGGAASLGMGSLFGSLFAPAAGAAAYGSSAAQYGAPQYNSGGYTTYMG